MLDFVLMISNIGPPALTLSAIAAMYAISFAPQRLIVLSPSLCPTLRSLIRFAPSPFHTVLFFTCARLILQFLRADLDSDADGAVSRIITLSYAITPLIALPVTAALQFVVKIEGG